MLQRKLPTGIHSEDDKRMRSYAKSRVSYWENIKAKRAIEPKALAIGLKTDHTVEKAREVRRDGRFIAYSGNRKGHENRADMGGQG